MIYRSGSDDAPADQFTGTECTGIGAAASYDDWGYRQTSRECALRGDWVVERRDLIPIGKPKIIQIRCMHTQDRLWILSILAKASRDISQGFFSWNTVTSFTFIQ